MVDGVPWQPGAEALIGRGEELAAIRRAVREHGCVLAGPLGVGKSRLARDAVSDEPTVMRVVATATARSLPYGAMSHLLPAGQELDRGVIPAFRQLLADADGTPVLLVDDAHLLDESSAALVHAVVRSGAARALVTVRSHEPTHDAITALWKDEGLERIELQRLGRRDVRRLVTELLGPRVHTVVHDRLFELTQGNPLFVHELVRDALRTGALQEARGRWHWHEELLEFDRVRVLVDRRVRRVSAAARTAMELLSVGAPLPLALVCDLTSTAAVEELERAGLIAVSRDPAREVTIAQPMYGEVVAADMPVTAALRHRRRLAQELSHLASDPGAQLRVATWLLEAGDRRNELFVAASRIALRRGVPELARRLARAAGDSFDAARAHGSALVALAEFDEADAVLAPHEADAAAAAEEVSEAYLEVRLRALLRGLAARGDADALLERAAGWHDSEDWEMLVVTQRAWIRLFEDDPKGVLEHLDQLRSEPRRPFHRFTVAGLRGLASYRLGRIDDCIAAAETIADLEGEFEAVPWEARFAQFALDVNARVQAGRDLEAVHDRLLDARAEAARAGNEPMRVVATAALGTLALRRGHADDAVASLQAAVDDLATADPAHLRPALLAELACARSLQGRVDAARRALAAARDAVSGRELAASRWRVEFVTAQAQVAAAAGRVTEAREALLQLAAHPRTTSFVAAQAVHEALRFGASAAEAGDRLASLAADLDEGVINLYRDEAIATDGRDAERLVNIAEQYGALGLDLDAATAAAAAARLFHDQGRLGSSRHAAALAKRFARRCKGASLPHLETDVHGPALSAREREIALLVAKGLSNREIAEELVLSVRTVESTVLRACRKLGIDNRHDLADLVGA